VVLAGLLLARHARAEETRVRLSWVRADDGTSCLDQHGLEAGVRARLGRDPFARDAPLSIEGTVARVGKLFRAELRVRDESGTVVGDRVLETSTPDCEPLAEAVVLAVALTIDPSATAPPGGQAPLPPSASVVEGAAVAPPSPPPVACPLPSPCPPAVPCRECPPVAPPRARVTTTMRAVASVGVLPGIAPGVSVAGGRVEDGLTVSIGLTWLPSSSTSDGRFSFGLATASAGACYGAPVGGGLRLDACGEAQAGAIYSAVRDGRTLAPLDVGDHPWLAIAAGPRLSSDGRSPFQVEGGVLIIVPIIRESFGIQGDPGPVFEPSAVGGLAYVGLGFGGT
jgi:hypothetical protein